MKIKSLMLAFALGFASLASAQTYQDVVFLKNGSEIRGVIMEQIPNESLKIKTNDGNLFVFKIDEVSKIAKEEVKRAVRREERDRPAKEEVLSRFHRTTGYAGFVELSGGWEYQDENIEVDLSTSHGVRLGSRFYLGGGIGVKGTTCTSVGMNIAPMATDMKLKKMSKPIVCPSSPMCALTSATPKFHPI